ncbi:hypothetical protein [Sphingobacterium tabacisoli]|uniref:DUF1963 domain-containing protein n=1 Tax=Sphingobacterium tabacisoli TaxID=2044855 RepID=A0ABW5L4I4_9SPHI|nr:hypothetical protein [Sphingobacterium tabacisoli]
MNNLIKLFPAYEEVFYDAIEQHRKYFLPICSFNLKLIHPEKDEWLHIISVKEIYDGRVGEDKPEYYTAFTKADMFGFDVIDGKYKFDADWNYFSAHTQISPEDYSTPYSDLEIEYHMNDAMYQLKKAYYQKYKKLYEKDFNRPGLEVNDIRRLERLRMLTVEDLNRDAHSPYDEERLQNKTFGVFEEINTDLSPIEDCKFSGENLTEIPHKNNGDPMDYIGCLEGYDFQKSAADLIFLFYDSEMKKAVIALEYT